MKQITLFVIIGLIIVSCSTKKTEKLDTSLKSGVEDGICIGVIASIYKDTNEVIYKFGSGKIEGIKEINDETQFEIGSITKTLTALLIAIANEEGKLSYGDPIEKFLPDTFNVPEYNNKKITILNLVVHNSGLPYLPTNVRELHKTDDFLNYTSTDLYHFLNSFKLTQEIGRKEYQYSLVGYGILGFILERIYKTSLNNLFLSKIAQPLGMERTELNYSNHTDDNYANGYLDREICNWYRYDTCVLNASGGIRSCIKDLQIYAKAQAGLIETPLYSAICKTHEGQFLGPETPIGQPEISLGWAKMNYGEIGHYGGTQGFCAYVGFNKGKTLVVLVNSNNIEKSIPWLMEICSNEMKKK